MDSKMMSNAETTRFPIHVICNGRIDESLILHNDGELGTIENNLDPPDCSPVCICVSKCKTQNERQRSWSASYFGIEE